MSDLVKELCEFEGRITSYSRIHGSLSRLLIRAADEIERLEKSQETASELLYQAYRGQSGVAKWNWNGRVLCWQQAFQARDMPKNEKEEKPKFICDQKVIDLVEPGTQAILVRRAHKCAEGAGGRVYMRFQSHLDYAEPRLELHEVRSLLGEMEELDQ